MTQWEAVDCATEEVKTLFSANDDQCDADNMLAGLHDFHYLLRSAYFGLVVGGEGTHSYRLLEVLAAGVVPVVLGGEAIRGLPFKVHGMAGIA